MRKTREILYLKWVVGRRHREIAESLNVGVGTVSVVVNRAKAAGLDWPQTEALTEADLDAAVYVVASRKHLPPQPGILGIPIIYNDLSRTASFSATC